MYGNRERLPLVQSARGGRELPDLDVADTVSREAAVALTARSPGARNAQVRPGQQGLPRLVLDRKAAAAERAHQRALIAQREAEEQQEKNDRELHRRMLTAFAARSDNTLQARQQLRQIEQLLIAAGRPVSDDSDDDRDDADAEEQEGDSRTAGGPASSTGGGATDKDRFVSMLTDGTPHAHRRKSRKSRHSHSHRGSHRFSGGSTDDTVSSSPAKKLRVIYDGSDSSGTDEEDAPMAWTDPQKMYARHKAMEKVKSNGVDDIDPQRTKMRYNGALILDPPGFSSSSLSRLVEVCVADAVEERLATENLLRVITDPQQKLWRVGSLDGEIARLEFHRQRLQQYIAAAKEQVPLYYNGSKTITEGSQEEVVLFRRHVIDEKESVDTLERHCERQRLQNDMLRRKIGALKEELYTKQYAVFGHHQEVRATPDPQTPGPFSLTPALASPAQPVLQMPIGKSRTSLPSSPQSTGFPVPERETQFALGGGVLAGSSTPTVQPTPTPEPSPSAPPLVDSHVVWIWAMSKLRHLLIARRTRLDVARTLGAGGTHTSLLDVEDYCDYRTPLQIGNEIENIDILIDELAPRVVPTLDEMPIAVQTQVRRSSLVLKKGSMRRKQ